MAKTRRVVRKVEVAELHTFDEHLWPVNVALLVMAGFVTGVIIALSSFSDSRIFYNGWFHLATLSITVGLLIYLASRLDSKRFRRTVQLAAVLSLLLHMVLMVVLYNQRLEYLARQEETVDQPIEQELVTLPDYHLQSPQEQQPEEHELPVEVETPAQTPTEIAREEAKPVQTPRESQPTPVPGKTPEVEPSTVKMAQTEQAVPRRADQSSKLSRQTTQVAPAPTEAVNAPQLETKSAQSAKLEAVVEPVERQPAAATAAKSSPTEPKAAPQQQTTQIARREQAQPTPTPQASSPTLTRQVRDPASTPRTEADAPQPEAVAQQADPTMLQPSATVSRRQAAGPEVAMQQSNEPKQSTSVEVARLDTARQQPSERPQPAATPQPTISRATQQPTVASEAADAPQATNPAPTQTTAQVAPAATQVARTDAASPAAAATRADAPAREPSTTPAAVSAAGAAMQRAEQSAQPSTQPQASPAAQIARASLAAPAAASPVNVESPAAAQSTETAQAPVLPSRTALAKGSAGVFGAGQEQNFDRGMTATRQPAPAASVSANRAAATQQGPTGPALSPSAPATIAKSIAGANVPSAVLPAQDVASADAAGAPQPSSLEASSSAAIQRAASAAPTAAVTAAAGSGEIDIGPTQVVANVGTGRAAGGGAPTVRLNTQGPQIARATSGGAPLAAIAAQQIAAAPEAPAAEGGGAPASNTAASAATAVATRSTEAGGVPAQMAATDAPVGGSQPGHVAGPTIARAAGPSEAVPGPAATGGVRRPARSVGRAFAADAQAQAIQLPTGPTTGDAPSGGAPQVVGTQPVRGSAGLPGQTTAPTGATAGDVAVDTSVSGGVGAGLSARRTDIASQNAPSVAAIAGSGPVRKTNVAGLPSGAAEMIDAPADDAQPAGGSTTDATAAASGSTAGPNRAAGSLPVQVAAVAGPGGLGAAFSPEVGSLSRRAQLDSDLIHAGTARFLSRKVGGPLAIDGRAREPAEAFSNRGGKRLARGGGPGLPTERTEAAVEAGLDFLARHQSPDGSWSLNNFGAGRPGYENEKAEMQSDAAATGLALLTYLGAGYDHYDDQYKHIIRAGLEYLVKNQKANGDLYVPQDPESNKSAGLYTHGIASIALCEAYGMTGDENLKAPAQKAIDFIVATQSPKQGGWRYTPQFQSDTSVSGWQLMALKSGELAGLKVPAETYARVKLWLDSAKGNADGSQYVYNPAAPNTPTQRHGRQASTSMTAVGLLMRMYTGWNRNDPRMAKGADHLLANLPSIGTAAQPARDTYYWYYATQVMFHMKGRHWQQWHEHLHPMLVERQVQTGPMAGSWDPKGAVPDRWATAGGRIYVTTLNLLSLEVAYRHLPIYESTAK